MLLGNTLKLRSNESDLADSVPTSAPPLIRTHKGMRFSRRVYKINEINSLILRNETIEDYLLGEQTKDYLFDLLAQEGIDPHFYATAVEDEIIYLMTNPDKLYA